MDDIPTRLHGTPRTTGATRLLARCLNTRIAVWAISLALVGCGLLIACTAGCAVGRTLDGKPMVGVQSGGDGANPAVDLAGSVGSLAGGMFGGPGGAVIGGSLATALAGLFFGRKRNELMSRAARADAQPAIDQAYDQGHAAGSQSSNITALALAASRAAAPAAAADAPPAPLPYPTS